MSKTKQTGNGSARPGEAGYREAMAAAGFAVPAEGSGRAGPTLVIRETQLGDPADYAGVTLTHGVLVF